MAFGAKFPRRGSGRRAPQELMSDPGGLSGGVAEVDGRRDRFVRRDAEEGARSPAE